MSTSASLLVMPTGGFMLENCFLVGRLSRSFISSSASRSFSSTDSERRNHRLVLTTEFSDLRSFLLPSASSFKPAYFAFLKRTIPAVTLVPLDSINFRSEGRTSPLREHRRQVLRLIEALFPQPSIWHRLGFAPTDRTTLDACRRLKESHQLCAETNILLSRR